MAIDKPKSNPFQFSLAWLLAYSAAMAIVCASLVYGRSQALAIYGAPGAQSEWNEWRFDVAVDNHLANAPVSRRFPKSDEPPALVLMRDYFTACVGLALLLSTVLFGTFMFFVRGALSPGSQFVDRSPVPRR